MDVYWPDGKPASYVPPRPGVATSGLRASSEYGWRVHPVTGERKKHWGIDLIGVKDGIVKAPFAGKVTIASYFGGYGNCVEITAPNGDRVRLGHNKSFKVKKGEHVEAGQPVAIWDNTGMSAGTHCHYETIPAGKEAINPRTYMTAHIHGQPSGGGGTPFPPAPPRQDEDDDMPRNSCVYAQRASDKKWIYLLFNYASRTGHEFGSGTTSPLPGSYTNPLAVALDTPSWAQVTESHYNVIKASLAQLIPLSVDINDRDMNALVEAIKTAGALDMSEVHNIASAGG